MNLVKILLFLIILYFIYSNLFIITPIIIGGFNYNVVPEEIPKYLTDEIKPHHILIVDVPNMMSKWHMEKNNNKKFVYSQENLFKNYLKCMEDHYNEFFKLNDQNCRVNYVFKNHQYSDKEFTSSTEITEKVWNTFKKFVREHPCAYISVAEDYKKQKEKDWKDKKYHYLRERDDFLAFRMAQMYLMNRMDYCVMSDDNFKDWDKFGNIPPFYSHYFYYYNNTVMSTTELLKPVPNSLGSLKDYKKINIDFKFKFT